MPRDRPTPEQIAVHLLARFGDPRFIHGIRIEAPPRRLLGTRLPRDSLFAAIDVPAARVATGVVRDPTQQQELNGNLANWEATLVGGALRDEFCGAGGRSLAGWSGGEGGISSSLQAFGQRFPNPKPAAIRKRITRIGRAYGFHVLSLRLLRPLQLAPLLIVETDRQRKAFARDMPAIVSLLNPRKRAAFTFEGWFLEARDANGPFVASWGGERGTVWGGGWSWNPCNYPGADAVADEQCR